MPLGASRLVFFTKPLPTGGDGIGPPGGDTVFSEDTYLWSQDDGDVVVRQYGNVTIDAGVTVTTRTRCKGLALYIDGDLTINGTLSMTGRGAAINPSTAGVGASGLTIARKLTSGGSTLSSDVTGAGDYYNFETIESTNHTSLSNAWSVSIPRTGGSGATAITRNTGDANDGGTVSNGTGGGGGGGSNASSSGNTAGGGDGTCFSGGSGGAGQRNATALTPDDYGGPGTDGASNSGAGGCGAGAGNPSGILGSTYFTLPRTAGDGTILDHAGEGTGGVLYLFVKGNISGSGTIEANGKKGGDAISEGTNQEGGGGGGSGGGVIIIAHGGTFSGPTTSAVGGRKGYHTYGSSGTFYYGNNPLVTIADGGAGGDGSVITQAVAVAGNYWGDQSDAGNDQDIVYLESGQTYYFTGSNFTEEFATRVVPTTGNSITAHLWGAGGGGSNGNIQICYGSGGGSGGYATGQFTPTAGDDFAVVAGCGGLRSHWFLGRTTCYGGGLSGIFKNVDDSARTSVVDAGSSADRQLALLIAGGGGGGGQSTTSSRNNGGGGGGMTSATDGADGGNGLYNGSTTTDNTGSTARNGGTVSAGGTATYSGSDLAGGRRNLSGDSFEYSDRWRNSAGTTRTYLNVGGGQGAQTQQNINLTQGGAGGGSGYYGGGCPGGIVLEGPGGGGGSTWIGGDDAGDYAISSGSFTAGANGGIPTGGSAPNTGSSYYFNPTGRVGQTAPAAGGHGNNSINWGAGATQPNFDMKDGGHGIVALVVS